MTDRVTLWVSLFTLSQVLYFGGRFSKHAGHDDWWLPIVASFAVSAIAGVLGYGIVTDWLA